MAPANPVQKTSARTLRLPGHDDTLRLGRTLARALAAEAGARTLLLTGGLGAGKTTLVRGLVEALPGGDAAEVSSPSFNICNMYPTRPETAHYDLYRLEQAPGAALAVADDALLDLLETEGPRRALVIVEWAERLPADVLPPDRLELTWLPAKHGRLITAFARGEAARRVLDATAREVADLVTSETAPVTAAETATQAPAARNDQANT
ncbi:tRNA (adenosine(37)-N6)-threonylcarbamoyltransferase complex ATPase subunit type 1 TsaE [Nitratidesulfovibrio sp. HK-II]|uniref:tRNA (adenosine(37)-N6)-threonylcarbamoyltransferase complex ATPase subunit type 1 TsaE n=1 Tax=Nitratidesulfovibrio sp. HK-II TaxID=2009266 RepID=UPI001559FC17|nr:tRNA (adenosine(37)-N6)-threonylcarbamoyltransferase complex ATPase subunit type 1 TsaE [Nitratidesulfovibrio sp. HK-II]